MEKRLSGHSAERNKRLSLAMRIEATWKIRFFLSPVAGQYL
jgi:hypothetical protein